MITNSILAIALALLFGAGQANAAQVRSVVDLKADFDFSEHRVATSDIGLKVKEMLATRPFDSALAKSKFAFDEKMLIVAIDGMTIGIATDVSKVGRLDAAESADRMRVQIASVTRKAEQAKLSPLFGTFSMARLSKEYAPCEWAIGPFEKIDRLTFEKRSQWKDPWNVGWKGRAIHNASLIEKDGKLFMFYRCNPSMESLSARIGLAIHDAKSGWTDWPDNPVIFSTLPNETLGCEDPKIYRASGRYFLFYEAVYSPSAKDRERYAGANNPIGDVAVDINMAESTDLLHWEKKGPIFPRDMSHLWAKAAVIAKDGGGNALKINGKYMMFVSEGCGGKEVVGYSRDMRQWKFQVQTFLDTRPFGRLCEVDSCVADAVKGDLLIVDFFYDDKSGVSRSGEALYRKAEPTKQIALNRGGTLNVGGMIRYQGRWIHAQGWDAPPGKPVMYIYGTSK